MTDTMTRIMLGALVLLGLLAVVVGLAAIARLIRNYNKEKADRRRCQFRELDSLYGDHCCRHTIRHYGMKRSYDLRERWWNMCFVFLIVDVCKEFGHARVIYQGEKLFGIFSKLLWRIITKPSQFTNYDKLWQMVDRTNKMREKKASPSRRDSSSQKYLNRMSLVYPENRPIVRRSLIP